MSGTAGVQCSAEAPGFVSVPVLLELVWVLTSAYGYDKAVVVLVIRQVLRTAELAVEDRPIIWAALCHYESGPADFADYVIAHRNHARGCRHTCTLDRRAAQGRYFSLVT